VQLLSLSFNSYFADAVRIKLILTASALIQSTFSIQAITDRGSFDRNSLDRNCVLSVDRNFHYQLTEIFDTFQLIKKFDQLPKKNLRILAVDRNFLKAKIPLLELSINCQNLQVIFWQLIKSF
jgi:hypothetical protein